MQKLWGSLKRQSGLSLLCAAGAHATEQSPLQLRQVHRVAISVAAWSPRMLTMSPLVDPVILGPSATAAPYMCCAMKLEAAFSILFTFLLHLTAFSLGFLQESICRRDLVHVFVFTFLHSGQLPSIVGAYLTHDGPPTSGWPNASQPQLWFSWGFLPAHFPVVSRTRVGGDRAFGEHQSTQHSKKTHWEE